MTKREPNLGTFVWRPELAPLESLEFPGLPLKEGDLLHVIDRDGQPIGQAIVGPVLESEHDDCEFKFTLIPDPDTPEPDARP